MRPQIRVRLDWADGWSRSRSGSSNSGPMPPVALTAEEEVAALKKGSADRKFLFDRNEVPKALAAKWFHSGLTTPEKFANIAKDVDDLGAVLKAHMDVDPERTLEERVQAASVTCAWTNARTRVARAAEVEAELDTKEWRKPVSTSEWLAMRIGLEQVDERLTLAKEYTLRNAYQMVALRHTNRPEFQGDYIKVFEDYKDYLMRGTRLWPECQGCGRPDGGRATLRPSAVI